MPVKPKRVTTAADDLYEIVRQKKEIAFKDAARILKVPVPTIEAWSTFLEEDGLLSIKYKFTTPYVTLPSPKKQAKQADRIRPLFQEKLEEVEIRSEMENAEALLKKSSQKRAQGEFGLLERNSNELFDKMSKVVEFISSRADIAPQIKARLADQLKEVSSKTAEASKLVSASKFDEASTAFSHVQERLQQLLEESKKHYEDIQQEKGVDEKSMGKLLESTYALLEEGKLEEAQANYSKIKKLFAIFSQKFVSEKSQMQGSILKLNRDLAVQSTKIKEQRIAAGSQDIGRMLRITNKKISQKRFAEAAAYYNQIKNIYAGLPDGFIREKHALKEQILKVFSKLANERERRLAEKFSSRSRQISKLLGEGNKYVFENSIPLAVQTYKSVSGLFSELPRGFLRQKSELHERIILFHQALEQKLEASKEEDMRTKSQQILSMLKEMQQLTNQGSYGQAEQTYYRINSVFRSLPAGFLHGKTKLQQEIIANYEALMASQDKKTSTSFSSDITELAAMVQRADENVKAGNYEQANALYQKIKAAYVKLRPVDMRQRDAIRNRILLLYKHILQSKEPDVHQMIEGLRTKSRARVRMPAQVLGSG
ncbi:hypothetical protein HYX10_02710 [Candidatus Woesearchaeota archaeon]|nr:hypothetical protein [Candidatus Woesearchaeota archaeon]